MAAKLVELLEMQLVDLMVEHWEALMAVPLAGLSVGYSE